MSFAALARELLKRWNIKGLILDVHQPARAGQSQVAAVRLAQKLSGQYFADPQGCKALLQSIAQHCKVSFSEVEQSIKDAASEMVKQAEAIGFKQFQRYLPQPESAVVNDGEQKLIQVMLQFNQLSQGPVNINELFRFAAQGTYDAIDVERVAVCILNPKAKRLESRYVHGASDLHISVSVSQVDQDGSQFSRWLALQSGAVFLPRAKQPSAIASVAQGDCLIAPLRISSTLVGMVYADAHGHEISNEVFSKFSLLANQVIALLATGNIRV